MRRSAVTDPYWPWRHLPCLRIFAAGLLLLLFSNDVPRAQAQDAVLNPPGGIDGQGIGKSIDTSASADGPLIIPDFRNAMRNMVMSLGEYAHTRKGSFVVLVRNGIDLLMKSEREAKIEQMEFAEKKGPVPLKPEPAGTINRRFVRSIDGLVIDGQFCENEAIMSDAFVDMLHGLGLNIVTVDHCVHLASAKRAYQEAHAQGIIAHADAGTGPLITPKGPLLPANTPHAVQSIADAKTALFIDGNSAAGSKELWVLQLQDNNYDVLVIDPFWRDRVPLSIDDIEALRFKKTGARRLVLARLNISQARDTSFYWNKDWTVGRPSWITGPLPDAPGQYHVAYWENPWRDIIGKMFSGTMELGFDGIVLEGSGAYAALESDIFIKTP